MYPGTHRLSEGFGSMSLLFFLVACLIIYGGLYPFEFSQAGVDQAAVAAFLSSWNARSGWGDILGNIVLFIPFGLLGQLTLPPRRNRLTRFLLLTLLSFIIATGLQVLQIYLPTRVPALTDVIWNMVGMVIGALLAFSPRIQAVVAGQRLAAAKVVPVLLLGSWIGSLLIPILPSIDMQVFKDSLKPLILRPVFDFDAFIRDFPAWLAAACLGAFVVGERGLPIKFAVAVLVTLALKIMVVNNPLVVTDVAAGAAAIVAFAAVIRHLPRREGVVAVMLLTAHAYLGLSPFEARMDAPAFYWMPFGRFLAGSMLINATALTYKVFFYGSLVWLLLRNGQGYVLAAGITIVAAGAVEIGQLYIGHGTPDITDPILALMATAALAALTPKQTPVRKTMAPAT